MFNGCKVDRNQDHPQEKEMQGEKKKEKEKQISRTYLSCLIGTLHPLSSLFLPPKQPPETTTLLFTSEFEYHFYFILFLIFFCKISILTLQNF